jgi:hypothetical protein
VLHLRQTVQLPSILHQFLRLYPSPILPRFIRNDFEEILLASMFLAMSDEEYRYAEAVACLWEAFLEVEGKGRETKVMR